MAINPAPHVAIWSRSDSNTYCMCWLRRQKYFCAIRRCEHHSMAANLIGFFIAKHSNGFFYISLLVCHCRALLLCNTHTHTHTKQVDVAGCLAKINQKEKCCFAFSSLLLSSDHHSHQDVHLGWNLVQSPVLSLYFFLSNIYCSTSITGVVEKVLGHL